MAEITLKRAVKLRSDLEKKIGELEGEARRLETTAVEKDEEAVTPERSMDEVIAEMGDVQIDLEALKDLTRRANITNTVAWDGQEITISRALDQATRMRLNANRFKALGARKKRDRQSAGRFGGGGDVSLFTVALYDPQGYRAAGEKMQREADRLSDLIDAKNIEVKIEIPFAEAYL